MSQPPSAPHLPVGVASRGRVRPLHACRAARRRPIPALGVHLRARGQDECNLCPRPSLCLHKASGTPPSHVPGPEPCQGKVPVTTQVHRQLPHYAHTPTATHLAADPPPMAAQGTHTPTHLLLPSRLLAWPPLACTHPPTPNATHLTADMATRGVARGGPCARLCSRCRVVGAPELLGLAAALRCRQVWAGPAVAERAAANQLAVGAGTVGRWGGSGVEGRKGGGAHTEKNHTRHVQLGASRPAQHPRAPMLRLGP